MQLTSRCKTISQPQFMSSCCTIRVLQQTNSRLTLDFSNVHSFISTGLSWLVYYYPSSSRTHSALYSQGSKPEQEQSWTLAARFPQSRITCSPYRLVVNLMKHSQDMLSERSLQLVKWLIFFDFRSSSTPKP